MNSLHKYGNIISIVLLLIITNFFVVRTIHIHEHTAELNKELATEQGNTVHYDHDCSICNFVLPMGEVAVLHHFDVFQTITQRIFVYHIQECKLQIHNLFNLRAPPMR